MEDATAAHDEPAGLPLDGDVRLGLVTSDAGARTIVWGVGPTAREYVREWLAVEDALRANAAGWNCRTHVEYEGQPAVDFYIEPGMEIRATTSGTARLMVVTVSNAFDVYGVGRDPYLGDPDRERAPVAPFPGPSGGKGVFVAVTNDAFRTEYAHLDFQSTLRLVPADAFLDGFSPETPASTFIELANSSDAVELARWTVDRGSLLGYSGDTGYSEAPHLHYTARRTGSGRLLCPSGEAGFADNGWLLK